MSIDSELIHSISQRHQVLPDKTGVALEISVTPTAGALLIDQECRMKGRHDRYTIVRPPLTSIAGDAVRGTEQCLEGDRAHQQDELGVDN